LTSGTLPLSHLTIASPPGTRPSARCSWAPTPHQLDDLLAAAAVELFADALDRIDEIVEPGTDLDPGDTDDIPRALDTAAWRPRWPRTSA
jgi:hypothetical protein